MSIANFIPTVWSARLMEHLDKVLVYGSAPVVNRDYENQIRQGGDSVKIMSYGNVTIRAYTRNSGSANTRERLKASSTTLTINQDHYFDFTVDDVDKIQAAVVPMDGYLQRAAYGIADVIDQYVAGLYTKAGITDGSDGSPNTVNSANVVEFIQSISQALTEANVPREGRWMVVPPWFETKMVLAKILASTENREVLDNGQIGRMLGFTFYVSNNVPISSSTHYKILAGRQSAITLAVQKDPIPEAYRPQEAFEDAVKGRILFDADVIQPDELLCATCDALAEA